MTVGSQACADALQRCHNDTPDINRVPYGWKYLNSGMNRHAFLCPHNVVYKVEYDGPNQGNEAEWDHYLHWQNKELPAGFAIPKMEIYYCGKDEQAIIAAEYIDGSPVWAICKYLRRPCDCADCKMSRILNALQDSTDSFSDSMGDNVLLKDGIFYLVDIEC